MGHHRLIAWIREEITSKKVVVCEEIVGWEETLEPNPEMYYSETTNYPTTRDRQHIIIRTPIMGTVERTVRDEERASHAAEALTALILSDERHLYLAEELMGRDEPLFVPYWEHLSLYGRDARTRRIALHRLGRTAWQIALRIAADAAVSLGSLCGVCVLICFYGSIIYLIWPDSKVGMWIAAVVKRILAEATRIIYD